MRTVRILAFLLCFPLLLQAQIETPQEYFGFTMGTDSKLAGWNQLVGYFNQVADQSPRCQVEEIGKTTRGNTMILAVISSEANMSRLDEIKAESRRIADPRGLDEAEARALADRTPAVVMITCSMHATEVGAAQMTPELVYDLVTRDTPEHREILDKVVFLLVPSFNPDGLILVKSWYDDYVDTEYEGTPMPWLYHHYVGHDNNRDAFMLTQAESRHVNRLLYHEWLPQVYLDMHQMGNRASRIFVPPFIDPLNPNTDPLIVREIALFGHSMSLDLEEADKKGVGHGHFFTGWWEGSFLMNVWWHNTVGLLTELASVKIASPVFQKRKDLNDTGRGLPVYDKLMNFPNPWPGGWWRLRDIVEYDYIAAKSLLTTAARHRQDIVYNRYLMGRRALKQGQSEPPFAFVIPAQQRDPAAARHMIWVLMQGGVEVHQAQSGFQADGLGFGGGSYVVLLEQPFRAFAKDLLERQSYPDIRENGVPIQPYDVAGWTLPLQMGVETVKIERPFEGNLVQLQAIPEGGAPLPQRPGYAWVLKHSQNHAFTAMNAILKEGGEVYWMTEPWENRDERLEPGDMIVPVRQPRVSEILKQLTETGKISVHQLDRKPKGLALAMKQPRIAVYQPWTSSMQEGWSRYVLEQYGFDFETLHNAGIRHGRLKERFDIIYLPDIWAEGIVKGRDSDDAPPLYANGIGQEGVQQLRDFVEAGGTLVAMEGSTDLLTGDYGVPVRNVLKNVEAKDFYCPGSILAAEFDNMHPLAYGMPARSSLFFGRSPAFRLLPNFNEKAVAVASYPGGELLKSGYLLGQEKLQHRVALAEVRQGAGRVVLIGFDAINRAQSQNTFKILFNALTYGSASAVRFD